MKEYTLIIKRYSRHKTFNTFEDLKEELGQYFTEKEKKTGIIDKLTTFKFISKDDNGFKYLFAKNNYQDFIVCCYDYID